MATTSRGGQRRAHSNYPSNRHITTFAVPPSPIPTAKGTRSAAADDQTLTDYFAHNLHVPYLHFPDAPPNKTATTTAATAYRARLPAQIDLRLLSSGVENSIDRLLRSAREYGVIRITGHGISREELLSAKSEVDLFFRRLDERKTIFRRSFVERIGNREEFVWFRSDRAMSLWAREVMGPQKYRDFSYKMESLVRRLDKIAADLAELLLKSSEKKIEEHIQETEPIVSLYRYNDVSPSLLVSHEDIHVSYEHALGLHLAMEDGEFYAHTEKGPLSFGIDPDTIVVTVGEQLVEWCGREMKSVKGEVIFDPILRGTEATSYSIELKCSPSNLNQGYAKRNLKRIALNDQILFFISLSFCYKLFSSFFLRHLQGYYPTIS
ncbi:hypothetical protein V2J09_009572 [Rumex salicifolius]